MQGFKFQSFFVELVLFYTVQCKKIVSILIVSFFKIQQVNWLGLKASWYSGSLGLNDEMIYI